MTVGLVRRTDDANARWRAIYVALADDEPEGLLEAAFALWSYSRRSAEVILGDAVGDAVADLLLAAIRRAGLHGLDLTGQSTAVGRNYKASRP